MPVRREIKLSKISGVGSGQVGTIDLPKNIRYHFIGLVFKRNGTLMTEAQMLTDIDEIRLNIDGTSQQTFKPAELIAINKKKGVSAVKDGFLPLLFSAINTALSLPARYSTAIGTVGVGTFQLEVDFNGDTPANVPTLTAFASVDDVQEPPVNITKYKPETIQVAQVGELTHRLDNGRSTDKYKGLFFFEDADGDISKARIKWENTDISDLTDDQNDMANQLYGFDEVDGVYHIDLDKHDVTSPIPMIKKINGADVAVQEFNAVLEMANANNVRLIREIVGLPD